MHNLVSFNQLSGSYEDEHDARLTEYYECLIECDDDQNICKHFDRHRTRSNTRSIPRLNRCLVHILNSPTD